MIRRALPGSPARVLALAALAACVGCASRTPDVPASHSPPVVEASREPVHASAPVTTLTPSGLTITDTRPGSGEPCPPAAVAEVRFVARLADGTEFDSSERRKRTLVLDLANPDLIAGLREGIVGMRPGGARRIDIPHRLAYGEQGREPVPPRTDLSFEIELVRWDPPGTAR